MLSRERGQVAGLLEAIPSYRLGIKKANRSHSANSSKICCGEVRMTEAATYH